MREVSDIGYRLIGHGVYTIPEAARLTRIAAPRIRRWLRGLEHRIGGGLRRSPAMIEPAFGLIDGMVAISLLDLVEIRFINAFVEKGVTWAYLRKAHERAVENRRAFPAILHPDVQDRRPQDSHRNCGDQRVSLDA